MGSLKEIVLIIKDISQIATDLIKCQLQLLSTSYKQILCRVLAWVLIVLTSILLAIGGLGMIMYAAYVQLSCVLGPAGSAYILGAFLLLLAIIVFLLARSMLKD